MCLKPVNWINTEDVRVFECVCVCVWVEVSEWNSIYDQNDLIAKLPKSCVGPDNAMSWR